MIKLLQTIGGLILWMGALILSIVAITSFGAIIAGILGLLFP